MTVKSLGDSISEANDKKAAMKSGNDAYWNLLNVIGWLEGNRPLVSTDHLENAKNQLAEICSVGKDSGFRIPGS